MELHISSEVGTVSEFKDRTSVISSNHIGLGVLLQGDVHAVDSRLSIDQAAWCV